MMKSSWYSKSLKVLWAMFLATLPVSSFPFFPGFIGETVQVRPLMLYPLFLLMILVIFPRLFNWELPRTLIPFFIFVLVGFVSTAFSFTRGISPPINVSLEGRVVRTLGTLALGGMFYLTVALLPKELDDLRFTLKWLYAGFLIALLWASFQIVYVIRFDPAYFDFMDKLQSLVSTRKLFDKRISGMTYEPSWFAEQLTFVLMPWLCASIFMNYSVFRWRLRWLTVETVLLGWSALALLFTFSRGGLAIFIILVGLTLFLWLWRNQIRDNKNKPNILRLILQVGLILVILGLIVFAAGNQNEYFSRLWGYWTEDEVEGTYFDYISFGQRFAYWETAYRIFTDYPVLGIGLGNFTFYFDKYLPDRQLHNPELFSKLVPEKGRNQIVTVKNFFFRLLAETGVLGTTPFIAFLVALGGCVLYLLMSNDKEISFWGVGGMFGLITFIPVTLLIDSFAIPNMWVVFGLITASAHVVSTRS